MSSVYIFTSLSLAGAAAQDSASFARGWSMFIIMLLPANVYPGFLGCLFLHSYYYNATSKNEMLAVLFILWSRLL